LDLFIRFKCTPLLKIVNAALCRRRVSNIFNRAETTENLNVSRLQTRAQKTPTRAQETSNACSERNRMLLVGLDWAGARDFQIMILVLLRVPSRRFTESRPRMMTEASVPGRR
jgi:hypothetical protein